MTADEMKFFDDMFRSLEREVHNVSGSVERMEARLDKIAAGSHYVTRDLAALREGKAKKAQPAKKGKKA